MPCCVYGFVWQQVTVILGAHGSWGPGRWGLGKSFFGRQIEGVVGQGLLVSKELRLGRRGAVGIFVHFLEEKADKRLGALLR